MPPTKEELALKGSLPLGLAGVAQFGRSSVFPSAALTSGALESRGLAQVKNLRLTPRIIATCTTASVGPFSQVYVVVADRFRRSDSPFLSLAHSHELRALCSSSIVAELEYCMTSRQSLFRQATRGTISLKTERARIRKE